MIFQNLAFRLDGSSILRGQGPFFGAFWGHFLGVFLLSVCVFGGIVFEFFIENLEFDMQITILSGPRASEEYVKKMIFRSKK